MSPEQTPAPPKEARRPPWRTISFAVLLLLLAAALFVWQQYASVPLSSISPAGAAEDVPLTSNLRLEFREPMDTDSRPQLQATPAISVTRDWLDPQTLLFRPQQPLQAETDYQVALSGDLLTAEGELVTSPISWQFRTGVAQIVYLSLGTHGASQLMVASLSGESHSPLTSAEHNVVDYAISTNGTQIVYSVQRESGGSEIRIMNSDGSNDRAVLQCASHLCTGAVWEPGDRRLIYERRALSPSGESPDPPQLWWLDPASGETAAVFANEEILGFGARFSADGRWLSYVIPQEETALVYNLRTAETLSVSNSIGEATAWHPFQNRFLTTDIEYQGETFSVHIFVVNAASRERQRLSEQEETNDAAPAWSPDGEWIAFTSKVPRAPIGRQLYLMRADGSDTQRLTSDSETNFGPPRWSLDGQQLLFQQYSITQPQAEPSVWLLDIESGQLRQIASAAYQPAWLP